MVTGFVDGLRNLATGSARPVQSIRPLFAEKEVTLVLFRSPGCLFTHMQLQAAAHKVCTSLQVPQCSHSPRYFSSGPSWLEESCPTLNPITPPSAGLLQHFNLPLGQSSGEAEERGGTERGSF